MATARRYAEKTDVPVGRSQGEIRDMLKGMGADQVAVIETDRATAVAFRDRVSKRFYRMEVPTPPEGPKRDQHERSAWRLLVLLVKAKLEAVKGGASTIEREFLADTMLPDGQTLGAYVEPQLRIAYGDGSMPAGIAGLLGGPSGG